MRLQPFLLTLALMLPVASSHAAPAPPGDTGYGIPRGAGGWGIFEKGVRLIPYLEPPATCNADNDGLLAMTAAHRLCLCDGQAWHTVNDNSLCQWSKP